MLPVPVCKAIRRKGNYALTLDSKTLVPDLNQLPIPGNTASVRVLEKLGMRREGLFLENKFEKGAWRNEYYYAILEQEWN